jgi:acyl-CoA synthetase (AMP-forming)/AMP-acid ligase II
MKDPAKDERCRQRYRLLLPNLADYVAYYARDKPAAVALIAAETREEITWKQFDTAVSAVAAKLLALGLRKGSVIATSLPLLKEHVYLLYACHRVGVLVAPLDLRLTAPEVLSCFARVQPQAYFFLGQTPGRDFRPLIAQVMAGAPPVRYWVQVQRESELVMAGAVSITVFMKDLRWVFLKSTVLGTVRRARRAVGRRDLCLLIFTTGSTGAPKAAVLAHENVLVQTIGLAVAFGLTPQDRMLVNLPPSHVECVTEQLATTIYSGATSVLLPVFDARQSLEAIQRYRCTVLGQLPALFHLEWQLPDYDQFDLTSLRLALYGGQTVSRPFLEKLQTMAPRIGTGLGLTETAGFCTYTDLDATLDEVAASIGYPSPLCPISIREPMQPDGRAGQEQPPGVQGEICCAGPQLFLGYLGDPESTAQTISQEGICYTGDLGSYDAQGLHFAGRRKFVLKPKGYQVFPEDIEEHIITKLRDRVADVACVGVEHEVFSEAILAFVECRAGAVVSPAEVTAACGDIAAYARPAHVEILQAGELPRNRIAKTDYLALQERAKAIVARLRAEGKWE